MAVARRVLFICIVASLSLLSSAQNCKNYKFPGKTAYKSCTDLPSLHSHLHWTHNSSGDTLAIAYRANQTAKGWIAWGINPTGTGMADTQALVAFQDQKGKMKVYTTQITSYSPDMKPGSLSFPVSQLSAQYLNSEMVIFAVVGPLKNGTTSNIVWQAGNSVKDNVPQMHPLGSQNIRSYRTLDFLST